MSMVEPPATYLPAFRRDIQSTVTWSHKQFGVAAAERYATLISQTLRDLLEEPLRPGTKSRSDLAPDAYVYHLMFSRDRVAGKRVRTPRYFVLYRYVGDLLQFARLLHDSRGFGATFPEWPSDLRRNWPLPRISILDFNPEFSMLDVAAKHF